MKPHKQEEKKNNASRQVPFNNGFDKYFLTTYQNLEGKGGFMIFKRGSLM